MKTFPIVLQNSLNSDTSTLCFFWRVERTDGQVFRFTDHDRDLNINGEIYLAGTGATPSAIQSKIGMAVSNLTVQTLLDSSVISEADLINGRWDYAKMVCGICDWTNPSNSVGILRAGTLGAVTTNGPMFVAEFNGLMAKLQQEVTRIVGPECDVELGSSWCSVNLTPFTFTGTISAVTNRKIFTIPTIQATNTFAYGVFKITSGVAAGLQGKVESSTSGGVITLFLPLPASPAVGDTYEIIAGCDKRRETCASKFSNLVNFQGFPFVPGTDDVTKGPL